MATHSPPVLRDRLGSDRGDGGGTALTWLLLFPAVLLLIFFGVQASQTGYARNLAQAAAEAGVRAAVSSPGDASRAAPAARAFLATKAGTSLVASSVSVTSTATTVTVTVTGTSNDLIPGGAGPITQTASGPLELFTENAIP